MDWDSSFLLSLRPQDLSVAPEKVGKRLFPKSSQVLDDGSLGAGDRSFKNWACPFSIRCHHCNHIPGLICYELDLMEIF